MGGWPSIVNAKTVGRCRIKGDAIDQSIQQMVAAAGEQAKVAEDVGAGVVRANSISEDTYTTVEQTRAAAQSIRELESQLSRLIEQFQT